MLLQWMTNNKGMSLTMIEDQRVQLEVVRHGKEGSMLTLALSGIRLGLGRTYLKHWDDSCREHVSAYGTPRPAATRVVIS